MTNEERDKVIRILQWLHDNEFLFRSTEEYVKYATKLAIQELEQEPCEDAISRQAVLDLCDKRNRYDIPYEYYEGKKYIRGWDEGRIINMTKLKLLPGLAMPTSPCDLCRYNPPSSGDGKPCTMCPAQERSDKE